MPILRSFADEAAWGCQAGRRRPAAGRGAGCDHPGRGEGVRVGMASRGQDAAGAALPVLALPFAGDPRPSTETVSSEQRPSRL